ncbi:hypothetical protein [Thermoflexibacter ruber]|uniref:NVEALA protein n=1 Tax=Thermoflexibacter ruber TaxID=1003 RepID=A0A1I2FTZ0_9BACT|nr:hypothetical protein [Thermoflexibacter ruber]SFF08894.1 hypothetical protein SAMN04488541_101571 [Thermoflexibacter ruber]
MKNHKKLAKGVLALSMALSLGTAIFIDTHLATAKTKEPNRTYNREWYCCEGSPTDCLDYIGCPK